MPWDVAGLLHLDGSRAQDRADGANVGDQVIALALVALDKVCRLRQRDGRVWFSCEKKTAKESQEEVQSVVNLGGAYRMHRPRFPVGHISRDQRGRGVSFFAPTSPGVLGRSLSGVGCR